MRGPRIYFAELSRSRANNFDFLRVVFSIMVIYYHAYCVATDYKIKDAISFLTHNQASAGTTAVDGFFAISGFLIAGSWLNSRGVLDYVRKRVLRIYPGFVVATLFCVFVVGPLSGVALAGYFRNPETYRFITILFMQKVGGLPGVFTHLPRAATVNDSLWTIRWEVLCYCLLASLGLAGWLRRRILVLALFVVFYAMYNFWYAHEASDANLSWLLWLWRLGCFFLAGTSFYLYRDRIPYSWAMAVVALAALGLTCRHGMLFTLPIFGPYLLFYVAFNSSLKLQNFAQMVGGDLSYGLYLYAYPVEQLLVQYSSNRLAPMALFLLSTVFTSGLAIASWHWVEKPFLRRKARLAPENLQKTHVIG